MNKSAHNRWMEWISFVRLIEEKGLKGMARQIVDHCICVKFDSVDFLTTISLELIPEHKYLWSSNIEDMADSIYEWLDDSTVDRVLLSIRCEYGQAVILPKTKSFMEKAAMFEKEHGKPTHH